MQITTNKSESRHPTRLLSLTHSFQHPCKWYPIHRHGWLSAQPICWWYWSVVHWKRYHNHSKQYSKSTQLHGELVQKMASETVSIKDKCGPFHKMPQGSYDKTTAVPLWRRTHTNEAVFLGVKFNSSLTWEPQIRALIAKAQPRLNLIKALVSSCGHNNNELLLRLYMAIVRPIFEYSSIAHVNAAACHHRKLQQIQNTAIRVILKIPNYIHTDILHDASGLPMLHERITLVRNDWHQCSEKVL